MNFHHQIVLQAIEENIITPDLTAIGVMDFDGLKSTVVQLDNAFPENFKHTFAVKANGLLSVLELLNKSGMGAEVASPGELALSLKAGFNIEDIIFDSPAKTKLDLHTCLSQNISVNIDNLQELERIDALIEQFPNTQSFIGFRINPQIGSGGISSTSTATETSKFGYPLADGDNYAQLMEIYSQRKWLTSIHTHTGSQGCPLELMAKGVGVITQLAEEINQQAGYQQIKRIDIGGGLPVNFSSDEVKPTFADYAGILKQHIPLLFTGKYQVKTEFGRAVAAKNGFILTRVEYTKQSGNRHIAITHAGAQIITRTAFLPHSWPIRVSGFKPDGAVRTQNPVVSDVAGPCCFAADLITKETTIPKLEQNDYVMIHDTGAYYFSNHFDYNSLPRVAVYAAKQQSQSIALSLIRKAENLDDVIRNMS